MAELFAVRHGQAAFGTDDYDRLTELGWQQARWLGEYFAERRIGFRRVVTGTLRRHRETLAGVGESLRLDAEVLEHPGLNEYDSRAMLAARVEALDERALARDRRQYFRLLREALYEWARGRLVPPGHPSYADFVAGVRDAFERIRADAARAPVLVVSSGGPISNLVGGLLSVPPAVTVDLNLQTRNTGIAQIAFNSSSAFVVSFNGVPHLDRPDRRHALTFS
ncbi:MAG: histidine phosphatase family protein [Burkholderiales bacterium]|nr:MAG: histidine phosphatase family protein [Burkholderiales bacterium]